METSKPTMLEEDWREDKARGPDRCLSGAAHPSPQVNGKMERESRRQIEQKPVQPRDRRHRRVGVPRQWLRFRPARLIPDDRRKDHRQDYLPKGFGLPNPNAYLLERV